MKSVVLLSPSEIWLAGLACPEDVIVLPQETSECDVCNLDHLVRTEIAYQ
jgi:hypothetical protein